MIRNDNHFREVFPIALCVQGINENRDTSISQILQVIGWGTTNIHEYFQLSCKCMKSIFSSKYRRKNKYVLKRIGQC